MQISRGNESNSNLTQVVRLEAKDDDCGEYGDICGYAIETESQPFDIDGKGQSTESTETDRKICT